MENDADRNEDCMFSAITRVFGISVGNKKAMVATEEEGTVMSADTVRDGSGRVGSRRDFRSVTKRDVMSIFDQ